MKPPDSDVKPTDSPGSEPTSADFEDCGWCDWSEDSGLNSEENFVWNRTTGADQDGVVGPTHDYENTRSSNSNTNKYYLLTTYVLRPFALGFWIKRHSRDENCSREPTLVFRQTILL